MRAVIQGIPINAHSGFFHPVQAEHETILLTYGDKHCRKRADRSGVDRYLGMVEAAGSIPARSIRFRFFLDLSNKPVLSKLRCICLELKLLAAAMKKSFFAALNGLMGI
jgi:hypothetical protein